MAFLDNLEYLMKKNNIKNMNALSKESGIPYTTLKNFYTRGTENVGLSTLKKISSFFDVTLDFLVYGITTYNLKEKESILLDSFKNLNEDGQKKLLDLADDMLSSKKYEVAKQCNNIQSEKQA